MTYTRCNNDATTIRDNALRVKVLISIHGLGIIFMYRDLFIYFLKKSRNGIILVLSTDISIKVVNKYTIERQNDV